MKPLISSKDSSHSAASIPKGAIYVRSLLRRRIASAAADFAFQEENIMRPRTICLADSPYILASSICIRQTGTLSMLMRGDFFGECIGNRNDPDLLLPRTVLFTHASALSTIIIARDPTVSGSNGTTAVVISTTDPLLYSAIVLAAIGW